MHVLYKTIPAAHTQQYNSKRLTTGGIEPAPSAHSPPQCTAPSVGPAACTVLLLETETNMRSTFVSVNLYCYLWEYNGDNKVT